LRACHSFKDTWGREVLADSTFFKTFAWRLDGRGTFLVMVASEGRYRCWLLQRLQITRWIFFSFMATTR